MVLDEFENTPNGTYYIQQAHMQHLCIDYDLAKQNHSLRKDLFIEMTYTF